MNDSRGAQLLAQAGDVPRALMHGRRTLPLGRYLRRKLREELGFSEVGGQPVIQAREAEELRALSAAQGGIAAVLSEKQKRTAVKILQLEGRAAIHKKRSSL